MCREPGWSEGVLGHGVQTAARAEGSPWETRVPHSLLWGEGGFLLLSSQRTGEQAGWLGLSLGDTGQTDSYPLARPTPGRHPSPTDAALSIFRELLLPDKAVLCWNVAPRAPQATTKSASNPPTSHSPREAAHSRTFLLLTTDPTHARRPIPPARWRRRGAPPHGVNACSAAARPGALLGSQAVTPHFRCDSGPQSPSRGTWF